MPDRWKGVPNMLFIFLALLAVLTADASEPRRRPNIVFLVADDLRWDALGSCGNAIVQTPNLDQLAARGVRFVVAADAIAVHEGGPIQVPPDGHGCPQRRPPWLDVLACSGR